MLMPGRWSENMLEKWVFPACVLPSLAAPSPAPSHTRVENRIQCTPTWTHGTCPPNCPLRLSHMSCLKQALVERVIDSLLKWKVKSVTQPWQYVLLQVCGSPDIPLHLLKSVATYKGIEPSASLIQWFWEVMESFSNTERSLFLRFVWGRTRLPRTIADFRGRDFVIQVWFLHILWCQLWGHAPCTRSYSRIENGTLMLCGFFLLPGNNNKKHAQFLWFDCSKFYDCRS